MQFLKKSIIDYILFILKDNAKKTWDFQKTHCTIEYAAAKINISQIKHWQNADVDSKGLWGTDWVITFEDSLHNTLNFFYSCWEIDDLITALGGNAVTNIYDKEK